MATTQNDNLETYEGEVIDKSIKESTTGNEYVEIRLMQGGDREMTARAWDEEPIADLKSIKRGQYVLIGCRDTEVKKSPGTFYHNIMWVNTIDVAPSPATTTDETAPNEEWTPSLNLRIAWNSAVNNAVNAEPIDADPFGENTKGRLPLHIWLDLVDQRANGLYSLILRGPTPPEPEIEPEVEVVSERDPNDDVVVEEL